MSYLEQEIAQQPDTLQQLLSHQQANVAQIASAIRDFNPAYVYIAARGTSDNAARYAQYLFGAVNGLAVALAAPSLHTLYEAPPNVARALVIGISQSGKSIDVLQAVQDARAQGALTLSITNDPASPMAQASHHHIALGVGEEKSIAATKTYTAQLAAIAMISAALAQSDEMQATLQTLPQLASQTLTAAADVPQWAERYRYMSHFVTLGRGYNYCTAIEISLKVTELCYVSGIGYSEADFLHGPIAQVQPHFPAMLIAPNGKTQATMATLLDTLQQRQAETLVITNSDDAIYHRAQHKIALPAALPEWLSPVVAVMPGQLFALGVARAKGHDLDRPRGLSKVTVTL